MRTITVCLLVCFLLSGCSSWLDGSYVSVTPHTEPAGGEEESLRTVANYADMCYALLDMVNAAAPSGVLVLKDMDEAKVEKNMLRAVQYIRTQHPLGTYAVKSITYEMGTSQGETAIAVTIAYNQNQSEILRIKHIPSVDTLKELVGNALCQCSSKFVVQVDEYIETDFEQMVRDYAQENPEQVMEVPAVTVNFYPETGFQRVVELIFTYQTGSDSLRSMQSYVEPVFAAAVLYVSGEDSQLVKYTQLYSFLMERNDYKIETSITPAYSLLRHGVGDSKAFSVVYTAMCKQAQLECHTVSGTKRGEPWYWNLICVDGTYYHVDLTQSHQDGKYQLLTDDQMAGYVWDYSAYPASNITETPS